MYGPPLLSPCTGPLLKVRDNFQVAGELSKNHEHMRMFMQTFVLEPQTPKKYYVRTAIFKYQDSVHDDNKQAAKSVAEDKKVSDKQPTADGTAPVKEEDSIQFGGPAFLLKRSLGLKEGKKPKWQVCKQVRLINIAPAKKVSDEQPRAEGTEPEKEEKPLRLGAPADEPQQSGMYSMLSFDEYVF